MPNSIIQEKVEELLISWIKYGIPSDYKDFPPFKPDISESCTITSNKCAQYFGIIEGYIRNPSKEVKIVMFDDPDNYGKVDLNFPDTVFISTFLPDNEYEIKRTLIHELAHLSNWNNSKHGDDKTKCSYFSSMPLVCEYCISGIATLIPPTFSNSKMNIKETECIISK